MGLLAKLIDLAVMGFARLLNQPRRQPQKPPPLPELVKAKRLGTVEQEAAKREGAFRDERPTRPDRKR